MRFQRRVIATTLGLGMMLASVPTASAAAQTADFAKYHSYSWIKSDPPANVDPKTYERIHASIDRTLAARGYREAAPVDFAVAFKTEHRQQVSRTGSSMYAPGWGMRGGMAVPMPSASHMMTEGTLAIEIFDGATNRLVWQGKYAESITPGKVDQKQVDRFVNKVLKPIPKAPR